MPRRRIYSSPLTALRFAKLKKKSLTKEWWRLYWVVVVMISIAIYQVPRLLRQKQWRELLAFGMVWLIAGVYAFLAAMEFPMPTLIEIVTLIYETIPLPFLKTGT